MKYIEAPNKHKGKSGIPTLFLGGGISNCKDWQSKLVEKLSDYNVTIYNPRRKDFDINNPKVSEEQIKWEHKYLHESNILVFYFAQETLCPITLFELGAALERNIHALNKQDILVYCEPEYSRKFDVELQTKLAIKNARKLNEEMNEGVTCDITDDYFVSLHDNYDDFVDELKAIVDIAQVYV
jgi:hypothetical protein